MPHDDGTETFEEQQKRWREQEKKQKVRHFAGLAEAFRIAKETEPALECFYLDYDGYGDEGNVVSCGAIVGGDEREIEDVPFLDDELSDMMETFLPDGYQDNEGASGRITFDGKLLRSEHRYGSGMTIPSPYTVGPDGVIVWDETPPCPWERGVMVEEARIISVPMVGEYFEVRSDDGKVHALCSSRETADYIVWALNIMREVG